MFLQGPDKHGRGVIILKASRHSKTNRDLEENKRLICHTLDYQIKLHDLRLNPDAKGVGIFDLRGDTSFASSSFPAPVSFTLGDSFC